MAIKRWNASASQWELVGTPGTATPSAIGAASIADANTFSSSQTITSIGSATPALVINSSTNDPLQINRFGVPSGIVARTSNGTISSPTAVLANERTAFYIAASYDGSTYVNHAAVNLHASEIQTSTARGSYITFDTTSNGTVGRAERIRISPSGRFLIGKTVDDTYNSFQLHTGFGLNGVGGYYTELNHNLIYSGGWKNAAQGPSSQIVMHGGANLGSYIIFSTDPASTSTAAGSASGIAERMRIDAAGKVYLSAISRDTSSQVRNITLSTSSASGGNDGDVWLTYTA